MLRRCSRAVRPRGGLAMIPGASRLPVHRGAAARQDVPIWRSSWTTSTSIGRGWRPMTGCADSACGDTLPATYPHMLAFPLQLALMTDGASRSRPSGSSTSTTRSSQHRPIRAGERLSMRVWADAARAASPGAGSSVRTEVRVGDELVWEEASTNLKRGGGDEAATGPMLRRQRGPAGRRHLAAAGRPRAALRRACPGTEPNPHPSADRASVRLPHGDRPRDVDQGSLPGCARSRACRPPTPVRWRSSGRSCSRRRWSGPSERSGSGCGTRRTSPLRRAASRHGHAAPSGGVPPRSSQTARRKSGERVSTAAAVLSSCVGELGQRGAPARLDLGAALLDHGATALGQRR